MKKSLALLAVLGCFSQSSFAATTFTMSGLAGASMQTNFRALSEDFGAAFSYKPVTPAAALGLTGFDIGIEVSGTDVSKSAAAWKAITGETALDTLPVARLHVAKGLPFGIDVAASMSSVPSTNIKLIGAELRYAILGGGIALPAIAVRAAMSTMSGVNELDFNTKSLDLSISKGFLMFTPYAGVGQVWVNSTPNLTVNPNSLTAQSFTLTKTFIGANLNFGLMNFALEGDKTGDASSASFKFGFRW